VCESPGMPEPERRPRATPEDAFRVARERFLAGGRVEMGTIAEELGLNRVTLYRWVGSREQLLVDVLWSLAEPTLRASHDQVSERGAERIVRILSEFVVSVVSNSGLRHFAEQEPDLALRLLTREDAGFQRRLIDWVGQVLIEEVTAGRLELRSDPADYAYALVRVFESFAMTDLITGEQSHPERAAHVMRLLLVR
jgi:AcrR family transcriptional regulator